MSITDINDKRKDKKPIEFVSNFELLQIVKEKPKTELFKTYAFPTLNDYLDGGFEGEELVVISGPGGHGKTLFCQTLTKDFCNNGHIPLWFPYEGSPKRFLGRFARDSEDLNFILPKELKPYSIMWICEAIRQAKDLYETEIVFIDHLHYVFDISSTHSVSLDIGSIMRSLKLLAVELGIVIFIICHTKHARIENSDDIGTHSIRDSSFISQESDIVLFIWCKISDHGDVLESKQAMKVCKSRRTGLMFKSVPIHKVGNYLVELDNTCRWEV